MNKKQQTSRISKQQQCHIFKLVYKRVVRSSHIHTLTHHLLCLFLFLSRSLSFPLFHSRPSLPFDLLTRSLFCSFTAGPFKHIAVLSSFYCYRWHIRVQRQRVLPLNVFKRVKLPVCFCVHVLVRDDLVIISYMSLYIFFFRDLMTTVSFCFISSVWQGKEGMRMLLVRFR